jgi:extracellular elastinolytic metalloproteinase
VNPYKYSTLKTKNEVHDIGEVWANTLVNVYAALVAAHGFDSGAKTSATGTGGNTIFLHLMLDGCQFSLPFHSYFPHSYTFSQSLSSPATRPS